MPRGLADDFDVLSLSSWSLVPDSGELACRLFSPLTHDRRGQVVHIDNFTYNLAPYALELIGTGAMISLVDGTARTPPYSAQFQAGADLAMEAALSFNSAPPANFRIGVQCFLAFETPPRFWKITIILQYDFMYTEAVLRWDSAAGKLQIVDETRTFRNIDEYFSLYGGMHMWHHFKLGFDFYNNRYLYALVDGKQYDLTSYRGYQMGLGVSNHLSAEIRHTASGSSDRVSWIDDLIITQAETL